MVQVRKRAERFGGDDFIQGAKLRTGRPLLQQ
jgi:hypothetical protein